MPCRPHSYITSLAECITWSPYLCGVLYVCAAYPWLSCSGVARTYWKVTSGVDKAQWIFYDCVYRHIIRKQNIIKDYMVTRGNTINTPSWFALSTIEDGRSELVQALNTSRCLCVKRGWCSSEVWFIFTMNKTRYDFFSSRIK